MHRIDHFCIGSGDGHAAAQWLKSETGLDWYEGGRNPSTSTVQRIVPLGGRTYLEINSVADHDLAQAHFYGRWYEAVLAQAAGADRFMGWVVAVTSRAELDVIAERIGFRVAHEGMSRDGVEVAWRRVLPSGHSHRNNNVPDDRHHQWPHGLPTFIHWPDEATDHPDTIPEASAVRHRATPSGIAWVEVGGERLMREWLGPALEDMDVRFVERPAGLYAVGINSAAGEIVIRRDPAPLELAHFYSPQGA